ncbi:MAG: 2OG-Fe(II) oxygenase [Gallionella sp.]|nr:2OG-Fe(II) oxygenase [Gallionella sp.]OIO12988.1 MAG: proline hydroxylase [Gallionellaceae bacterium CG1_02_60_325]PIR09918.1 MAG: proline hydroxylase [Gallionellaceae bacterium CG11_big_fil_rev_8_21_14_0_20_60_62]PIV48078.1 MAG: proline hydroxylase [Gallionellaceae bacterium CG02_land_8_20_14_3_00_60_115]PIY06289.1 MAG: proline hydroxylase [Gallionellaceae bacterium CG_4_10_14_3_um_filter_60_1069]PJC04780.1 MAG: proline hydroxylase [Gallionellaceae bacterium CG_4_9_14_0_8_um_filter_60_335]
MDIAEISKQLEDTGYIVLAKPLADDLLEKLFARCQDDPARFHAAQVGRGAAKREIGSIRGDVIDWLDADNSSDRIYLACMDELRLGLNAALFLGLFDYECHYAIYEKGAGYAKHSDVLQGKKNRILTTVLYLNKDWQAANGGELVVYDPTGMSVIARVNPAFGTMIIFLSESFPHEVLTSLATRRSITGWFRVSGS